MFLFGLFLILMSYYFYLSYLVREEKIKISNQWDGSDIHPTYKIKKYYDQKN